MFEDIIGEKKTPKKKLTVNIMPKSKKVSEKNYNKKKKNLMRKALKIRKELYRVD